MVEIKNLCAGYGPELILDNLSAQLPAGQVTVVTGPNGCGKSTFLKALAGILPSRGEILWRGSDLNRVSQKVRAQKISYLPQGREVPAISVERLVLHGRFPYLGYPRQYRRADRAAAAEAISRMGLEDLAGRDLASLSGGQRQRAYIAMALAQDTDIVLMDEPTTYLDIAHQLQLMALARELAAAGKAVVLVIHDLALALEQGDRVLVMEDGAIRQAGTGAEVFGSGCLGDVFGVEVRRMETPDGWRYYYKT